MSLIVVYEDNKVLASGTFRDDGKAEKFLDEVSARFANRNVRIRYSVAPSK